MKAIININNDDDFRFLGMFERHETFPVIIPVSSLEEGAEAIREWIWHNAHGLYVNKSAERQKDHIKLHTGKRQKYIEKCLEKLYSATYNNIQKDQTDCSYLITNGNWSFQWTIK